MDELEWLSSHPKETEKYIGKWVAITSKGVVASADDVSEVESQLNNKGISLEKVMVMKVPRRDEEMSIL